ncbi:ribonuclease [Caenimonas sedimenti]|uniref:Ribonuclease n=1 Tax=Caenimonas sedimenti TaxID=2596921 RepID=A0A562ZHI6_9BURK|nr:ribonuclease [Caenimonas sedimenti]TWO67786.1 ribonuclease [Caenimonas sedimenti]
MRTMTSGAAKLWTGLALFFGLTPGFAQEVCKIPVAIDVPAVRSPDYVNKDKPTDYMALVLSWSPQHCEGQRNQPEEVKKKHAHQCFSVNQFEWVVHGLWPQNAKASSNQDHPRHCNASAALPSDLLKQHLCMMPGVDLMQNEWQAHGTCGWSTGQAYFSDIQKVYGALKRPTTQDMVGSGHGPNRLIDSTARKVKASFLALNPSLEADQLRVNVASGNRLKEIWLCLDNQLKPAACPAGGTPDQQAISVRTPHQ